MMRTSQSGINMIKSHEGLRLRAYQCPAGVWTIGYGSTYAVTQGLEISEADAEGRLRRDLRTAERAADRLVQVDLSQGQFDALVSFTFNLGAGALESSTLLRKLNAGDYEGAQAEFPRWRNARVNGVLTPLPGLVRRRADEAALFASGIEVEPEPVRPIVEPVPVIEEHQSVNQSGSVNAARAGAAATAVVTTTAQTNDVETLVEHAGLAERAFSFIQTVGPWVALAIGVGVWVYIEWRRRRQIAEAKR